MNPNNLKTAKELCAKRDQLLLHQRDFTSASTDNLPEEQFNRQQEYAQKLLKDIKTLEKQIAEL